MRFDSLEFAVDMVRRCFQVELGLHAHPKWGRGLKIARQPKRDIGRDRRFLAGEALNARARNTDGFGQRIRCESQRYEKFLAQNFTGVNRRKLLFRAYD